VLGTGDKTLGSGAAALVGGLDKLNIGAATLLTEMAEIDANRALLSPAGQALATLSNAIKNDAALQLALVNSPYLPDLDPTTLATATGAAGKLLPELPDAYDAVAQISGGLSAPPRTVPWPVRSSCKRASPHCAARLRRRRRRRQVSDCCSTG